LSSGWNRPPACCGGLPARRAFWRQVAAKHGLVARSTHFSDRLLAVSVQFNHECTRIHTNSDGINWRSNWSAASHEKVASGAGVAKAPELNPIRVHSWLLTESEFSFSEAKNCTRLPQLHRAFRNGNRIPLCRLGWVHERRHQRRRLIIGLQVSVGIQELFAPLQIVVQGRVKIGAR